MDNNKKDPSSIVDGILDDIMKKLGLDNDTPKTDLGPDEKAIKEAGLIRPDEMELEQIIKETQEETWNQPEEDPEQMQITRFFAAPAQEPAPQTEPAFDVLDDLIGQDVVDLHIVDETNEPEDTKNTTLSAENVPEAEEVADAPAPEEAPPMPVQKNMPVNEKKMKKNKRKEEERLWGLTHIVSTAIWLFLIVAIGVTLGRTVWLCATDLLALGKESISVSITIEETDDIEDVADKLKKAGLIEYPKLFKMFTSLTGKGENILRGTINFNPEDSDEKIVYDYNALINAMSYRGSKNVEVKVLIPEGYNCAQIFALLEEKGVCSASALEKYAADGDVGNYWFLDGVERGHKYCLEGYLFPDTYNFYRNDEAERVIKKLLNGFDARFTDRLIDKMVAFNNRYGTKYTIREFVIMASIVEKETSSDVEGYTIASVFYNRLRNPGSYPFLQSDATIKYDVEYRSKGELVTNPQINASPYNTYTQKGLPPGPISNPGLASLDAALDPEETSYYFFIWDKDANMHRFSKTLSEHSAWARKLGIS